VLTGWGCVYCVCVCVCLCMGVEGKFFKFALELEGSG